MVYLLFNPLANSGNGEKTKDEVKKALEPKYEKIEELDITKVVPAELVKKLKADDKAFLLGGDGTLMHFANAVKDLLPLPCPIYLYKAGTGNDFLNDVKDDVKDNMIEINKYLEGLPTVYINDNEYEFKFINGIGYGLDGVACEVADKQRAAGKTKVNYTTISINLLLFKFKRPSADITVDGVTKHYKKVWLASGMNGRYYGGGMMITPMQDRFSGKLTSCVIHDSGRLATLIAFPKIFEGKHINKKKMCDFREGNDITVEFSRPCALQIDGETFLNVKKYRIVKK